MSRAATRLRAILREEPVAFLVESGPGRPLRDADGDAVDALVFLDQCDAEQAVDEELREHPDAEPLAVVALIRRPEDE